MRNLIYLSRLGYIVSWLDMSYQDIIEEKQVSVLNLDYDDKVKKLYNPLYMPIIKILREGYRTFKEIKAEYTKYSSTVPPDKTLYRHLNSLKEAGLIFEIGKRVYKGKSMTEKLFARTAKFFRTTDKPKGKEQADRIKKQAILLSKFFALTKDIRKDSTECIEAFLTNQNSRNLEVIDELFTKFPDEVAKIAGNLPHDDLQAVVEEYVHISIILNFPGIRDELKKCLGIK